MVLEKHQRSLKAFKRSLKKDLEPLRGFSGSWSKLS